MDVSTLLDEAFKASSDATSKHIAANPGIWYPCGFAWVNIKPARGPVIKELKARDAGSTDSYYGGYSIWNPSGNSTQWMDAKEEGARAFAKVLNDAGIKCTVGTRID